MAHDLKNSAVIPTNFELGSVFPQLGWIHGAEGTNREAQPMPANKNRTLGFPPGVFWPQVHSLTFISHQQDQYPAFACIALIESYD